MNPFERQLQLSRAIMEQNMSTVQRLTELDSSSFAHQMEANQEFLTSITSVQDAASFAGLQRKFAEHMWGEYQGAMETRAAIVQENMERIGSIMQDALQSADQTQEPGAKE